MCRISTRTAALGFVLVAAIEANAQSPGAPVLDQFGQPTRMMLLPADDLVLDSPNTIGTLAAPPGVIPVIDRNDVRFELGMKFIVPVYSDSSFRELLPGTTGRFFPGLDFSTTVRPDFWIAPVFEAEWDFTDSFGVKVSGFGFTTSGTQNLSSSGAGFDNNLAANSNLTIFVANLPEIVFRTRLEDFLHFKRNECVKGTYLGATILEGSLGTRYTALRQDFGVTLTSSNNVTASTHSEMNYDAFGLTGSINASLPLTDRFVLYCRNRGSVLFGDLRREATYNLNPQTTLADTFDNTLVESRTETVPVGEFEAGFAWHNKPVTTDETGMLAWIKLGFVAELWGNMGLISASDRGFDSGNLFLYGFVLEAGLSH